MKILPIEQTDFEEVLSLNEASVPHVNLISHDELQWFAEHAAYLQVATIDEKLAGFLVGLRPGTSYPSPNYRWFCDNYEDFAYVDRVAVSEWARRRGVAESLYARFAESQAGYPGRIVRVEAFLDPALGFWSYRIMDWTGLWGYASGQADTSTITSINGGSGCGE